MRSVEAATRDDAIAAAREQFGPAARVVGVRRVRSGGVLGFFATERYVAEVAPDPFGAPVLPAAAPARPAGALTEDPDTGRLAAFGSPLASAAPARARTAPSRNGAAAWAAEAARPERRAEVPAPRPRPADDERVDELAGLLGLTAAPAAAQQRSTPATGSRPGVAPATFPRATREAARPSPEVPGADDAADLDDAPSPFTAALARMVAGDRDVQHAVREALETAETTRPGAERPQPDPDPESEPEPELGAGRTMKPAVWSRATRQKEETVGDQVIAPPSTSVDERTESPSWADELTLSDEAFASEFAADGFGAAEAPEADAVVAEAPVDELPGVEGFLDEVVVDEEPAAAPLPVSREEAIAEVLRAALAEGHSDDALAGILRRVVAGDAPQADPVEPSAVSVEPTVEAPALLVEEAPAPVVPEVAAPVVAERSVSTDLFGPLPFTPAPVPAAPAAVPSASTGLWGEVVTAPAATAPAETPDEPIAPSAPVEEFRTSLFGPAAPEEEPTDEVAADEVPAAVEDAPVAETAIVEDVVEDTVEDATTEDAGSAAELEVAPLLARTASDPAPVGRSMTMDETSVMPPLSLLPGSPSRGRGLPPVPPRTGRPPVPPSQSRVPAAPSPEAGSPSARGADDAPASPRTTELLATVTRLPVGPLMADPETPDMPELADLADLIEADGSGLLDAPELPAAVPARPSRVRIAPPSTPAEVVSRLSALGVPAELLGPAFTADVAADGIYAALTRALGQHLPEPPELPTGAGDVLFVVGPGVETLRAARSLAATMRLDPDRVQWATRGDLVGLSPETSRMSTVDAALRRRQDAATSGSVTIVAVDAPLRSDAYWMAQMLAIWTPVAVWAVVEATRKPEDIEHWLDGLARVDALIVQDTDLSADPAVVLADLATPVAVVDGLRATPHRWASVLCERLESAPA
ncbi:hypothetical protein [Blastococcus sp. TF02-09]|uniref:hypothetical protein n=1 Tax=Blastococcus sp. TF02-09 TaxID=2250576 RepID=UPI0011BE7A12|nr:hypothetical protein [Blastococcus sp. TF02-9]